MGRFTLARAHVNLLSDLHATHGLDFRVAEVGNKDRSLPFRKTVVVTLPGGILYATYWTVTRPRTFTLYVNPANCDVPDLDLAIEHKPVDWVCIELPALDIITHADTHGVNRMYPRILKLLGAAEVLRCWRTLGYNVDELFAAFSGNCVSNGTTGKFLEERLVAPDPVFSIYDRGLIDGECTVMLKAGTGDNRISFDVVTLYLVRVTRIAGRFTALQARLTSITNAIQDAAVRMLDGRNPPNTQGPSRRLERN